MNLQHSLMMIGTRLSVKKADEIVEDLAAGKEVGTMIRLLEKAKKEGIKEGIKEGRLVDILEAKKQFRNLLKKGEKHEIR